MIPGLSKIGFAVAVIVGGLGAFGLSMLWTQMVTLPAVRAETRAIVEAEAERRTINAIHSVGDAAERARAMRRYCSGRGLVYDFAANKCRS